jgi:hypothetical protein
VSTNDRLRSGRVTCTSIREDVPDTKEVKKEMSIFMVPLSLRKITDVPSVKEDTARL